MFRKVKKILLISAIVLAVLVISFLIYFRLAVVLHPPEIKDISALEYKVENIGDDFYKCNSSWLRKSASGLWEMYLEGSGFELGVINGKLSKQLIEEQEEAFVNQIKVLVPSENYLNFLKYFVAWFNKDIESYIKDEYLNEIFGVSEFASDKYSFIGSNYMRILNYHAAHDIGHALQDMSMVGCTSFSVWDNNSKDSSLIVGRNFDFYVGDEFAENKIICFIKPNKGYKFMMVTWAGMIGAVSGMNEKGLTVTINAAKSEMPYSAKTPISILTREILQYASNIHEAFEIAKKREIFVSESIMIGSRQDRKTVIIEKSPKKIGFYQTNNDYIICSNHFQSDAFFNDSLNVENIRESSSMYRYQRLSDLIKKHPKMTINETALILRDQKGIDDKNIGMGNEKAINQLIAHHSVIFKPNEMVVWVSTKPWQLGEYVAYDLKKAFNNFPLKNNNSEIIEEDLTIGADVFLHSPEYKNFIIYRQLVKEVNNCIMAVDECDLDEEIIKKFQESNPEYFLVYSLIGDYYLGLEEFKKADHYYNIALTKEITTKKEMDHIYGQLKICEER